ncbi:MAG: class I SAM-dependent methyltransferase [Planctomycetes bacterium]|nr:class I SAM-dependent methyltransferase [Planctomycetota bacterium]MCH7601293.1 class I SAM-dependent methyltransferase [Planctomycetota bacterium]
MTTLHDEPVSDTDALMASKASNRAPVIVPGPHRDCPICDTDNANGEPVRYSRDPWQLKQCRDCGLVYLENPPGYEALSVDLAWEKSYTMEMQRRRKGHRLHYLISDPLKRVRVLFRGGGVRRKEQAWIARHVGSGRLLDVGCGTGRTLMELPKSIIPYGIEISEHLAAETNKLCRSRGGYVVENNAVDGMGQFEADFFDGMMLRAFLEHETQPRLLLEAAQHALAPKGRIIIKVPNYSSVNRVVRGGNWCGFRFPDHVNYFTPETLRRVVEMTGFRVTQFGVLDRFPFNDNMWLAAEKPAAR